MRGPRRRHCAKSQRRRLGAFAFHQFSMFRSVHDQVSRKQLTECMSISSGIQPNAQGTRNFAEFLAELRAERAPICPFGSTLLR
jgi:hypothetical protein